MRTMISILTRRISAAAALVLALGSLGCNEGTKAHPLPSALAQTKLAKKNSASNGAEGDLLNRLGGIEGLKRIADALLLKLAGDESLPAGFRLQFLGSDREPQRKQLLKLLGEVVGDGGKNVDFAALRSEDPAVRRRLEQLVEEAAAQAGVAAADRADLAAAWQKASVAVQ